MKIHKCSGGYKRLWTGGTAAAAPGISPGPAAAGMSGTLPFSQIRQIRAAGVERMRVMFRKEKGDWEP